MAKNKDRVTFTWARAWRLDTFLGQAYGWNLYDLIPVEPGGSDSKYAPAAKWLTENSEKDPDIVDSFFDIIFEKPKTVGGTLVRKAAGERCSPDEMWGWPMCWQPAKRQRTLANSAKRLCPMCRLRQPTSLWRS
jgi:hypothetical protein